MATGGPAAQTGQIFVGGLICMLVCVCVCVCGLHAWETANKCSCMHVRECAWESDIYIYIYICASVRGRLVHTRARARAHTHTHTQVRECAWETANIVQIVIWSLSGVI